MMIYRNPIMGHHGKSQCFCEDMFTCTSANCITGLTKDTIFRVLLGVSSIKCPGSSYGVCAFWNVKIIILQSFYCGIYINLYNKLITYMIFTSWNWISIHQSIFWIFIATFVHQIKLAILQCILGNSVISMISWTTHVYT